jgi:cyclophilin family peptidyl-prolyl cis-trans isomerase
LLPAFIVFAVPNFLVQGGDISHANGVGGESIYGGYFEDESFEV